MTSQSQNPSGYDPSANQALPSESSTATTTVSDISAGTPGSPAASASPSSGIAGHAISQAGTVQFSNMDIPNLQFPAALPQIQESIVSLPSDQMQQWQTILTQLPQNTTYSSLQELQQAAQQVAERQMA